MFNHSSQFKLKNPQTLIYNPTSLLSSNKNTLYKRNLHPQKYGPSTCKSTDVDADVCADTD